MDATFIYFLKANIALALFYAFYRLLFVQDTFFKGRRTVLILFWIFAFSYPLAENWTWIQSSAPPAVSEIIQTHVTLPEILVSPEPSSSLNIQEGGQIIYGIVLVLLLFRFCIQLGEIIHLIYRSKKTNINGVSVYCMQNPSGPFSFFRWIFVYPKAHSERELEEIIIHEQTHTQQWHSIDIILAELFTCLCWFNPFAWLLKREVRDNLEYLADSSVLRSGCDSKSYQYHLLGLTYRRAAAQLYTNFNVLSIKNRIRMMNKRPTKKIGMAKFFLLFPLLACLLLLSNCKPSNKKTDGDGPATVSAYVTDLQGKPIVGATVIVKGETTGTITDADGKFTLNAPQEGTLSIAFIDFDTKEIAVKDVQTDMKIQLNATVIVDTGDKKNVLPPDKIYTVVEKQPVFPGGFDALIKYLGSEVKYPVEAQEKGIQGRVVTSFIVRKDGTIDSIKVMRGIDPMLDAEAMRVVKAMPKWKPAEHEGEKVSVRYVLPIQFKLQ